MIIGTAPGLIMGPCGAMRFAAPNPRALLRNLEGGVELGYHYSSLVQLINLLEVQRFHRTPPFLSDETDV